MEKIKNLKKMRKMKRNCKKYKAMMNLNQMMRNIIVIVVVKKRKLKNKKNLMDKIKIDFVKYAKSIKVEIFIIAHIVIFAYTNQIIIVFLYVNVQVKKIIDFF